MINQVNFIENPATRGALDKPIGEKLTGAHFLSVYIEVSPETYFTENFRDWLNSVYTKVHPTDGSIRIAIINSYTPEIN